MLFKLLFFKTNILPNINLIKYYANKLKMRENS